MIPLRYPSIRTLLTAMLMIWAAMSAGAKSIQTDSITLRRAFEDMPPSMIDLLNRSTRMDMLDYMAADSIWHAPNNMEGVSYITRMTGDFLEVRLTNVSLIQIKILPYAKAGNVVAAAYTIQSEGNSDDTELRFFDSEMRQLPTSELIQEPRLKDFFNLQKADIDLRQIELIVPFPTIRYDLSPDSNELRARLTVKEYLGKEDYAKIEKYIKPEIIYRWNSKKYVIDKQR